MRSRAVILIATVAIVLGGVLLVPSAMAKLTDDDSTAASTAGNTSGTPSPPPSPSPRPSPSPVPATLKAQPVSVTASLSFFSWALMDRTTGRITGAKNLTATNSTESMIKAWIVSDYLRRTNAAGRAPTATRLNQATRAIRDSDDNAAESLYEAGGEDAVVMRLIKTCKLTDTTIFPSWWSRTQMSPRDAVRMGNCIADGRAAGPKWTTWVLDTMQKVRGTTATADQHRTTGGGRWGIIDGLPAEIVKQGVSIKNGWTIVGSNWHINCLAIGQTWVLEVAMRYPGSRGLTYGAKVCASVARQLVVPATVATP